MSYSMSLKRKDLHALILEKMALTRWSWAELARRSKVDQSTVNAWQHGTLPTRQNALAALRALDEELAGAAEPDADPTKSNRDFPPTAIEKSETFSSLSCIAWRAPAYGTIMSRVPGGWGELSVDLANTSPGEHKIKVKDWSLGEAFAPGSALIVDTRREAALGQLAVAQCGPAAGDQPVCYVGRLGQDESGAWYLSGLRTELPKKFLQDPSRVWPITAILPPVG